MKLATNPLIPALALAVMMACGTAWAQEEVAPLPEAQKSGSTEYVTGGIPTEQIPSFNRARHQYPLNIEVYEKGPGSKNGFTADAQVKLISKSGGVVLDATASGPYLWAKVPPGQYTLQTTLNGKMKESRVAVRNSGITRAVVVFPPGTDE